MEMTSSATETREAYKLVETIQWTTELLSQGRNQEGSLRFLKGVNENENTTF